MTAKKLRFKIVFTDDQSADILNREKYTVYDDNDNPVTGVVGTMPPGYSVIPIKIGHKNPT